MVKVVVVGAGMAGLMAACRLREAGLRDVVVLEARTRVGGRFCPMKVEGGPGVQLGAHWIHGGPGNALFDYCERKGLFVGGPPEISANDHNAELFAQMNVYVKGPRRVRQEVVTEASRIYEASFSRMQKDATKDSMKSSKLTLGQVFDEAVESLIGEADLATLKDEGDLRTTLSGCRLMYLQYTAYPLEGVDARSYLHVPLLLNEPDVVIPDRLLETILEDLGEDADLRLGHVVRGIHQLPQGKIQVTATRSRDHGLVTLKADHVVCTLPLGVIKNECAGMFQPPLPKDRLEAIRALEPGAICKYYVSWSHDWRVPVEGMDMDADILLAMQEEPATDSTTPDWTDGIVVLCPVDKTSSTGTVCLLMMCWIGGPHAIRADLLPDQEVLQGIGRKLRSFVSEGVPDPDCLMRATWSSDPFTLGAYSSPGTAATPDMFGRLAEPLPGPDDPRLLFAGEAVHDTKWSYLHGAFLSGIEAADRIISFHGLTSGSPK